VIIFVFNRQLLQGLDFRELKFFDKNKGIHANFF